MSKFKQTFVSLKSKGIGLVKDFIKYWDKPKDGDYVSNKEFTYFILGTSGNNSFTHFIGYLSFGAGCLLLTAIYDIGLLDFTIIATLGIPFSYIFTPINMLITDNLGSLPKRSAKVVHLLSLLCLVAGIACYFVPANLFEGILSALPQIVGNILISSVFNVYYRILVLKKLSKIFGKYRSWIIAGLIPTMLMYALIVYLPFDIPLGEAGAIAYPIKLAVLHMLFCLLGTFNSFSGQVANIQNVISPKTEERTKIIALGSFAFSLLPSLCGMFIPALAEAVGGKAAFASIKVYRYLFPAFMVVFGVMTLILAFKVKERVIFKEDHRPSIGFFKGSKAVLKNKYFWIGNMSTLFSCISGGSVAVLNVFFLYTTREMWVSGIYVTLVGMACVPGMLIAPWLIKKMGKRNMIFMQKCAGIISSLGSFFAVISGSTALFIFVNFLSTFISSPTNIASSAMNADQWDYQQYISGERLDGFSGIFGLLLLPLTTIGGYLIPTIYKTFGLSSDMDILYIPDIRRSIMLVTAIIGSIAGAMSVLPYFFYDLSEKKHGAIIEVLKERAGLLNPIVAEGSTDGDGFAFVSEGEANESYNDSQNNDNVD